MRPAPYYRVCSKLLLNENLRSNNLTVLQCLLNDVNTLSRNVENCTVDTDVLSLNYVTSRNSVDAINNIFNHKQYSRNWIHSNWNNQWLCKLYYSKKNGKRNFNNKKFQCDRSEPTSIIQLHINFKKQHRNICKHHKHQR